MYLPWVLGLHIDSSKSLFLRREFGVVGKNGKPLTFNKADDTEQFDQCSRIISGHFTNLLLQQANAVLDACSDLAKEAELNLRACQTPQEFLTTAETLADSNSESFMTAQKSIREYNEIREMVMQFSTPKMRLQPFELTADNCRPYFTYMLRKKGEEVLEKCAKITKNFIIFLPACPKDPQEFLDILPRLNVQEHYLQAARQSLEEYNKLKEEILGSETSTIAFMAESLNFTHFFIHGPFSDFLSALNGCKECLSEEFSVKASSLLNQVKQRVLNTQFALSVDSAYQVLGVSKNASLANCNKAYKLDIGSLHADKRKEGQEAPKLYQVLTAAIKLIRSLKQPEEKNVLFTAALSKETTLIEIKSGSLNDLD